MSGSRGTPESLEFKSRLRIRHETLHWVVRTAETAEELKRVLELRARCFGLLSIDPDPMDLESEHLIVEDSRTGKICCSYRMTLSDFTSRFESSEDFHLETLLREPGRKVELAWACVDPDDRNQPVISLLWRGLALVFRDLKPRYVFGLTSFDAREITNLQDFCKFIDSKAQIDPALQVYPIKAETSKAFVQDPNPLPTRASPFSLRKAPGLLRTYLLAGALIFIQPVFDPDLGVFDFFTVLDMKNCESRIQKHFHF